MGLTIEEVRRRFRAAAQDIHRDVMVKEVEEERSGSSTDGEEGSIVLNAAGESLQTFSTAINDNQKRTNRLPSGSGEEKNVEHNTLRTIKKRNIGEEEIEVQNQEQEDKITEMEPETIRASEDNIEEMKVKLQVMERRMAVQAKEIERLEARNVAQRNKSYELEEKLFIRRWKLAWRKVLRGAGRHVDTQGR